MYYFLINVFFKFISGQLIDALVIGILTTENTEPEYKNPINLNGTWKIYGYAGNLVENEYMTFSTGTVTYLKDNNERKGEDRCIR